MKPFYSKSINGFTLVELLVSAIISGIILSVSLSLINTQREQFLTDQNRNQANQNLRAAIDLIGTDIKLAGERLDDSTSLPVIQLINGNGTDGDVNEHDRLILQRKVISDVLTVCEDVATSDKTIVVAIEANLPITSTENCSFSDIDNGIKNNVDRKDALTDNLNEFKTYRCDLSTSNRRCDRDSELTTALACSQDDECAIALIVDPSTGNNELFYYSHEECIDSSSGDDCDLQEDGDDNYQIKNIVHAIPLEGTDWSQVYTAGSEIYLFEEREYSFDDDNGILNLMINREDDWVDANATTSNGDPLQLVNQIEDFSLRVRQSDGSYADSTASITDWTEIRGVEVNFESGNPSDSDLIDLPRGGCPNSNENRLCLSAEFFPRNALNK